MAELVQVHTVRIRETYADYGFQYIAAQLRVVFVTDTRRKMDGPENET